MLISDRYQISLSDQVRTNCLMLMEDLPFIQFHSGPALRDATVSTGVGMNCCCCFIVTLVLVFAAEDVFYYLRSISLESGTRRPASCTSKAKEKRGELPLASAETGAEHQGLLGLRKRHVLCRPKPKRLFLWFISKHPNKVDFSLALY